MPITVEQVDQWRATASENENLEFKEAKTGFDFDKLCDYSVAIGNEGGGHLILGISDKPPRAVVGTKAFQNRTDVILRTYERLGFRVDLDEIAHPDGRVVVAAIPGRPRGTVFSHKGRYLMRAGESLVSMSEDRLRAIFDEGRPDWLEEPATATISAAEVIRLLDTQAFFELLEFPYPTRQSAVIDRLVSERPSMRRMGNTQFGVLPFCCLQRS